VLEVRGLTKRYQNAAVVDHVSFTVPASTVTGYLGPNGSGKSTTVKMLAGLIQPDHGHVLYNGVDIHHDLVGFKQRLGYVPEEAHVYPHLTGIEFLELTGRLRCMAEDDLRAKANELLLLFSLGAYRHAPLSTYSKGMRQRVLISAALLHDPEVIIFDEPLSGLDVTSALVFRHLVRELASRGKVILYISHVLEVVEKVCSKVIILYKGRVMADETVGNLRGLMDLPSLEEIFSQLVQQEDTESVARQVAQVIRSAV
jgi:ABC-2 type transport system ATP-binding protein